ncbi:fructose-bisphosphate aldolase, class I [Chitinophaga sp. CF118]|uniref:class I fructose-bisphosphate aldolase n=1 Tax=Chitinophaga sp. CF118 TaxID=1884367 RepID=UPI0008E85CDE|nr:class I fructose-bisphosphate aldolase [Chitinophaga sp. CF118]SFE84342.1 fructose-bisphosphate aldolase, class I [Chitinophaga sp. CF118]
MKTKEFTDTAKAMMAGDKGLLAMDESTPTCNKRFAAVGIPQTEEYRRAYRDLIVTTPRLNTCISGAILSDETIRQQTIAGIPFAKALHNNGIIPGIKVDLGAKDLAGFPEEKITEGLDLLRERLTEYYALGARFAKWRAVITIGKDIPTSGCMEANMHALARYAALCQEAGIVPIVEPEVLMDGSHTLEQCKKITQDGLLMLFSQLHSQRVDLHGVILKPNMILPGKDSPVQVEDDIIAHATIKCLLRCVPASVPGVAFLSGGQSPEQASSRLNAIHIIVPTLPWAVTFSYARAIQQPALELWAGKEENVAAAQKVLFHRADCNRLARKGKYSEAMEKV